LIGPGCCASLAENKATLKNLPEMSQEKRIEYLVLQNKELVRELYRLDYLLTNTKAVLSRQQKAFKLLVDIQKVIGFPKSDKELLDDVAILINSNLEMAATYIYEPSESNAGLFNLVSSHDTKIGGSSDLMILETLSLAQLPEFEKCLLINTKTPDCLAIEDIKKRFRLLSLIIYPVFHNDDIKLIIVTGIRVIDETVYLDLTPEDVSAIEAVVILLSSYFRKTEFIKLYEADRFKSEFISNISHEFRTPLTLVLGLLEQFKGAMDPDEDSNNLESLGVVINNAQRLKQLIDQLLDMSRIETESEHLQVDNNSLGDLVTRIAKSFFALSRKSGIEFNLSVKGNVEDAWFDGDKLEKILTNLLDNAFKYTSEKGKVEFSVSIENCGNDKNYAHFEVSDTGRGIPKSESDKIFERFYRSENNEDSAKSGTGIGLYLVKKLTELHHGKVEVDSLKGKGTKFTVTIPTDRKSYTESELSVNSVNSLPSPSELTLSAQVTKKAHDNSPDNRPCLLIVEDNIELNSFLANSLAKDYLVLEAFDGTQGFTLAYQNIPDLIVTDVMMPVSDGYELCIKLRNDEKTKHIPVIMLTARADRQSTIKGLDCGADDYISKPFDMLELSFKIRNRMETYKRQRDKYMKEFIATPDESLIPAPEDTLMNKVIDLMRVNIPNPDFHVNSLCDELYISRTQLYRKVEALTGYSPAGFMRILRLKSAAVMFRKGYDNIAQVMYKVGVSNQSNFARNFREQFGVNPSAYISSLKKGK
jgi:signal transduction histidine kinase/CheY-like chemotaxis protein